MRSSINNSKEKQANDPRETERLENQRVCLYDTKYQLAVHMLDLAVDTFELYVQESLKGDRYVKIKAIQGRQSTLREIAEYIAVIEGIASDLQYELSDILIGKIKACERQIVLGYVYNEESQFSL